MAMDGLGGRWWAKVALLVVLVAECVCVCSQHFLCEKLWGRRECLGFVECLHKRLAKTHRRRKARPGKERPDESYGWRRSGQSTQNSHQHQHLTISHSLLRKCGKWKCLYVVVIAIAIVVVVVVVVSQSQTEKAKEERQRANGATLANGQTAELSSFLSQKPPTICAMCDMRYTDTNSNTHSVSECVCECVCRGCPKRIWWPVPKVAIYIPSINKHRKHSNAQRFKFTYLQYSELWQRRVDKLGNTRNL